MSDWKIGDLYTVDPSVYPAQCHGVIYRVIDLPRGRNGVNFKGEPVVQQDGEWVPNPGGRGVRSPAWAMRHHDPEQPRSEGAPAVREFVALPERAALVRVLDEAVTTVPKGVLFVVSGYPRGRADAVQLTRLGGDGGRYWKAVPVQHLEVIDPDRVKVLDA